MALQDIETLLLECRCADSKSYAYESFNCYNVGAYRSAVIAIWIAVTIDFAEKIIELADGGDAEAKRIRCEFERIQIDLNRDPFNKGYLQSSLNFENAIISRLHSLELIDAYQQVDLLRIKEDRNKCAHPTYHMEGHTYNPSAEQTRAHIVNAILHLLSQPPLQGRAAKDKILNMIYNDKSAIANGDLDQGIAYLEKSPLAWARSTLVKDIIKTLFFDFISEKIFVNKCIVTYEFLHRRNKEILDSVLGDLLAKHLASLPDKLLHYGIAILNQFPHLANKIDGHTITIIRNQIDFRKDWLLNAIIIQALESPIFRSDAINKFNMMSYQSLK